MISAVLSALASGLEAIKLWLKGRERSELKHAGINQQKVTDHEAKEAARAEKRRRDDHIRRDVDANIRLRQHFYDPRDR